MRNTAGAASVLVGLAFLAVVVAFGIYVDTARKANAAARYEALVQDCVNYGYPRFRCEAVLYKLR